MAISNPLPACNWLQNEWPWMTLSGYFKSNSVFVPALSLRGFDVQKIIIVWKVTNIDPNYQRQTCTSMALVSGDINFVASRRLFSENCPQMGAGGRNRRICSFPVAVSSYRTFQNKVTIIVNHDNTPFCISAYTNKDDLEWPWMPDSTYSAISERHAWRT